MSSINKSETVSSKYRFQRFWQKPWPEKVKAAQYRWVRMFPFMPMPIRLPFGGWWLARNDFVGAALFHGGFEDTELSFVDRFLLPGMTVLDIGAHHGFYTLLASYKVGPQGKVLAVEPSAREREKLALHLRINGCRNVQVERCALGEAEGDAELYLVHGGQTGCNSLKKPAVSEPTEAISIHVKRLDSVLAERCIEKVDLVKLDVEGGELSVLKGGQDLLRREPRPLFLVEVQDIRTRAWGYEAREIIDFLSRANYRWFRPVMGGRLRQMDAHESEYDSNCVAIPLEKIDSLEEIFDDH
jgi:FkbM family methyltransferase